MEKGKRKVTKAKQKEKTKPHKKCNHMFFINPGKFPPDPNLAIALSLMCEQTSGTVMPGVPMHEAQSMSGALEEGKPQYP